MRRQDARRVGGGAGTYRHAAALVLLGLSALLLAQACGQSTSRSGPSQSAGVGLKVRRAEAQLPAGCTGTLFVTGPGVNLTVPIPASGEVTFQAPVGVELTLTAVLNCAGGTFTGSTTLTVQPGGSQATVTVVASQAGVSCSPSTVEVGQSSSCVCTVQSPVPNPTIGWTGPVSPKSGPTTTFSSGSPGAFAVTCTVNNVASATTTVNVTEPPPQTGTIEIFNDALSSTLRRRGLASHANAFGSSIHARVVGVPNTTVQIDHGHSARVSAPTGPQQVQASTQDDFSCGATKNVTVVAGQEVDVHFDAADLSDCL